MPEGWALLDGAKKGVRLAEDQRRASRPPLPDSASTGGLRENGRTVPTKRYSRRDKTGLPTESAEEMFWRVACHVAGAEAEWGGEVQPAAETFYELLASRRFFPNSP